MAGSAMKKLRKEKIQKQLNEQRATKYAKEFTSELKNQIAALSEDELAQLSESILALANEENPTMEQVTEVVEEAFDKTEDTAEDEK